MTLRRFHKTCALLALALLVTLACGCQFIQNEFFYLCPTPQTKSHTQTEQDQDSGLLRHRQTP